MQNYIYFVYKLKPSFVEWYEFTQPPLILVVIIRDVQQPNKHFPPNNNDEKHDTEHIIH